MAHSPPPPGVYVPVPTFFLSSSSSSPTHNRINNPPLDPTTQAAHALHLARSGITGLVVLGSTGEAVHLTDAERDTVVSGCRKTFDENGFPHYPIIAGTAAQNIEDVIRQLQSAKDAGAQWGLCLVPGYFAAATTQEGIVGWFEAVADRSPVPVMVYHYPGVSNNVRVLPATFATLSRHPNIVGCKLSHGDVSFHAQIAANPNIDHANFRTFTGLGQQLLPVVSVGCAGAIDGAAGFFPKAVVRLFALSVEDKLADEDLKARRLLQYRVSVVEELVVKFGTVGIKEAIARILGMGERDGTRLPLAGGIPGGDREWENWKEAFAELEAIERSL